MKGHNPSINNSVDETFTLLEPVVKIPDEAEDRQN
jgi:hypothetical protein